MVIGLCAGHVGNLFYGGDGSSVGDEFCPWRRIAAAACFLPLTVKPRLSKELGTRHRAAIGVTEETDAVAIIVSEESATISFAHDGEIERFLDPDTLRLRLRDAFERKTIRTPRTVVEPAEHGLDT